MNRILRGLAALVAAACAAGAPAAEPAPPNEGKLLSTFSQGIWYAGSKVGYRMVSIWRLQDGGHRLQTSEFLNRRLGESEALYSRVLKVEVGPGGRPRSLDGEVFSGTRSWRVRGRAERDEFVLERTLPAPAGAAEATPASRTARIPLEDDVTLRSWALYGTLFRARGAGELRRWRVIDETIGGLLPDPVLVRAAPPQAFGERAGPAADVSLVFWQCGPEAVTHLVDGTGRVLRSVWQSSPRAEEMMPPAEARRPSFSAGPAAPGPDGLAGDRYRSARLGFELYVPPYPFALDASPADGAVRLSDLTDEASVTVRPALDPEESARQRVRAADLPVLAELVQRQWAAGYDEVHAQEPYPSRFAGHEAHMIEGTARLGCTAFYFRNILVASDPAVLLVTILSADRTLAERRDLVDPLASSIRLTAPEGGLPLEVAGPLVRVPFYGLQVRRPSPRWIIPARLGGPSVLLALARDDGAAVCVVRVFRAAPSRPGADALAEVVADQAQRAADNLGIEKPRPAKAELAGREALELAYEGNVLGGRPARCRALYTRAGDRVFAAIVMFRKDADDARVEAEAVLASLRLGGEGSAQSAPGDYARGAVSALGAPLHLAPGEYTGGAVGAVWPPVYSRGANYKGMGALSQLPPGEHTGDLLAAAPLGAATGASLAEPATDSPPVASLLVLGVASDEAGLGPQIEFMLRQKARRLGAIVYDPSSVAEALAGRTPTVDTPPEDLARLARDLFKADAAVVGRARGVGKDYQVRLVTVYASGERRGRTLDRTYACAYHQIIPLEMAKAVREMLGLAPLAEGEAEDAEAERRWHEGPNLIRNPGFETPNPAGDGPADWQPVEREMAWVPCPDGPGKAVLFRMSPATADSYGLDFYSDWIPLEPGATYRFSVRLKSLGPATKIFLKGYHAFPPMEGYPAERRETYRRQVHPKGENGRWETVVADFVPGATRPEHRPTFLKVDLYAYHPAGEVYWDDAVLKKIRDAPPPAISPR